MTDLRTEIFRLQQKRADLSRDLAAIEERLEQLRQEEHRRFMAAAERVLEGKK